MKTTEQKLDELLSYVKKIDAKLKTLIKAQAMKSQPADSWGTYEEARKLLARSKAWYKLKRLDRINEHNVLVTAKLVKGKDWRLVGNRVEYRLDSIKTLKDKLTERKSM
jgi:hypothetical protein